MATHKNLRGAFYTGRKNIVKRSVSENRSVGVGASAARIGVSNKTARARGEKSRPAESARANGAKACPVAITGQAAAHDRAGLPQSVAASFGASVRAQVSPVHKTGARKYPQKADTAGDAPYNNLSAADKIGAAERFLDLVCERPDISSALKKCGLTYSSLYDLLLADPNFRTKFDDRASLKLELAAFDIALRGNATLTGFLLSNRLPERYRKGSIAPKNAQPPQIVFIGHDSQETAHED